MNMTKQRTNQPGVLTVLEVVPGGRPEVGSDDALAVAEPVDVASARSAP